MSCGVSNATRAVAWFKNGRRINETSKAVMVQRNFYILCIESSDSGEYVCKDKFTLSYIDSHSLSVKNQGMYYCMLFQLGFSKFIIK